MATNIDVENVVRTIVSRVIKVEKSVILNDNDLIDMYGMDSMQRVEIVIELEKAFDLTISDEESIKLRSISSILSLVEKE